MGILIPARSASLFDGPAELPRTTVTTTLPTVDGTTFNVSSGNAADLQTKINSARADDGNLTHEVVVPVATYTLATSINIPAKSGSNPNGTGRLIIRSANSGSLPASGTRIIPGTHAANMPTITTATINTALFTVPINSHYIHFFGLNITATVQQQGPLLDFGNFTETSATNLPHHLVVDRCYIHGAAFGGAVTEFRRGISLQCGACGVVDSYISDFYYDGGDSQCMSSANGSGPFKIQNNYLSGAGENIIFGGSDPAILNQNPSDITISGNHFTKNPAWFPLVPSGSVVKNFFETKFGQRILLEGNVFEGMSLQEQNGWPINLNNVSQNLVNIGTTTSDITFRYNVVRSVCAFIVITGAQQNAGIRTPAAARFSVNNNLVYDMGTFNGEVSGQAIALMGTPVAPYLRDVSIKNNTTVHNYTAGSSLILEFDNDAHSTGLVFDNNVATVATYGIFGTGGTQGSAALAAWWNPNEATGNVLIGDLQGISYPAGNANPANVAAVSFTNAAGKVYSLGGGSSYLTSGKGGTLPGVDYVTLRAKCLGAVAAGVDPIP